LLFFVFNKYKNLVAPQLFLMAMFVFTIFFSVVASGWIGGGFNQAELFLRTAFIPFVLISGLVDTTKKQHLIFLIIIVASFLTVINGHVQVTEESGIGLVGNPILIDGGARRIRYLGPLSDPNDLGMFLVMSLPLLFYFKERIPSILRFTAWCGIGLVLYGVYLTNSRGTLLATVSLVALWFWRKYGTTKFFVIGLGSSPILLIASSSFREISSEDESSQGRLDAWYQGIDMLKSNPLFGVGQGAFTDYHELTAHNSFVLAFAELGVIGCFIWVALLMVTLISLTNINKQNYLPEGYACTRLQQHVMQEEAKTAITLIYSILAFMVSGFFLSRTYIPILYLYLGLSAACFGRILIAFPKLPTEALYKAAEIARYSFLFTFGGIVGIYLLLRLTI
jgi:putative inorganic carbon (HCO3(-)) transporter